MSVCVCLGLDCGLEIWEVVCVCVFVRVCVCLSVRICVSKLNSKSNTNLSSDPTNYYYSVPAAVDRGTSRCCSVM